MTTDPTQEQLTALRKMVESDHSARMRQAEVIGEMRAEVRRAMEWMTTLTFDDQGLLQQGETPPILRLLASIQNDNVTIREQNARIIEQNALLIGEPTNEEAAVIQEAQARGGVSLPALLKRLDDVRFWVRSIAAVVVLVFLILALHHWYLVDRFTSALGWISALLR